MRLIREHLPGVWLAQDVAKARHNERITIGGVVICRQRPSTAHGFVFISVEDETGVANAVVPSELFESLRLMITQERFLRISGPVQTRRGLPIVRAEQIERLSVPLAVGLTSHDFR